MSQRLGRAEEGESALLLLGKDLDRDARRSANRLGRLLAVLRLADRRGRDGADLLRPQLLGQSHLGRNDLADFADFLLGDPALFNRLADPRISPLLHHLLQLPVNRLGHKQPSGVGPNINGGAKRHRRRPRMFPGSPDLKPFQCAAQRLNRSARERTPSIQRRSPLPRTSAQLGCEASSNSRKRPVTTKATCSPMSTALSPTRSIARAASSIVIAHSRLSASSPIARARWKHSRLSSSTASSRRTRSRAISTSRSSKARFACTIRVRVWTPIFRISSTISGSAGA